MNLQAKVNQIQHFLNQAINSPTSSRATQNLELAKRLMKELETATLSFAGVSDQHIETVVGISRSPYWMRVASYIEMLQN